LEIKSQSELIKHYDSQYILVSKKYFVELHQKSTKFDSLKVLFSSQERLLNNFKSNYDSLKTTFNLKLDVEKEKNLVFKDVNEKLISQNRLILKESDNLISMLGKEKKKNKILKKITLITGVLAIGIFIIK